MQGLNQLCGLTYCTINFLSKIWRILDFKIQKLFNNLGV